MTHMTYCLSFFVDNKMYWNRRRHNFKSCRTKQHICPSVESYRLELTGCLFRHRDMFPLWFQNHESWSAHCGMIQCLKMAAVRHKRLISLPCGLSVFCTENSVPSYFLSLRFRCISKGLSDPAEPNDSCAHTVCSRLGKTWPLTKMISQVNPTTKGTSVSISLLEPKAVLKSLGFLISLWTTVMLAAQPEDIYTMEG